MKETFVPSPLAKPPVTCDAVRKVKWVVKARSQHECAWNQACDFAIKITWTKASICSVCRCMFSLSSLMESLKGLSAGHWFFIQSSSSACVWEGMRFWVGVIPSRTAFCSLTEPCKGSAGCRNKLYWWEREIRCADRAELLMPFCPVVFRCFLCAPSRLWR